MTYFIYHPPLANVSRICFAWDRYWHSKEALQLAAFRRLIFRYFIHLSLTTHYARSVLP